MDIQIKEAYGKQYKVYNDTYYNIETPNRVIEILDYARMNNKRIRVFYGGDDGRDWLEVFDTIGTVSRSIGQISIPLLIKNSRSIGGCAILDACIVKITIDKVTVYQAENYHLPTMEIRKDDFGYEVYADKRCIYGCDTMQQAENKIAFHKGLRNREY